MHYIWKHTWLKDIFKIALTPTSHPSLYAEFLKRTDTCQRKLFQNIHNIFFWKAKLAKQALFHIFGTLWRFCLQIFYVFKAILVHNSAQNCIKLNSDRAKEFTLRMSVSMASVPADCEFEPPGSSPHLFGSFLTLFHHIPSRQK